MSRSREDAAGRSPGEPVAVIDIGSNSGRMVVFRLGAGGHLDVVEDARAPLRLGRALRDGDVLGSEAIERALEALRDFQAIAAGAGASRAHAVATSAVREAVDGPVLVRRAREEIGIDIRAIEGDAEAAFGFLGAVRDLPVDGGLTMDVGGGSMELTRFEDRRAVRSWTLPLGSLRLSDAYLTNDPPTDKETRKLRDRAETALRAAGIPALAGGERLVGIGGTVRNLAKIDRRRTDYPLPLLHGYMLPRSRLEEIVASLAARRQARRASTPGLNPDRVDTIVGGGLAVLSAMATVRADTLMVSSRGVREGVALHALGDDLPPPDAVRASSIRNLGARFSTWDAGSAERRASIAGRLHDALEPEGGAQIREMLQHAAAALDIGRAIDYYERFEHAAMLMTAADVGGFSHHGLGLLVGILRQADDDTRLGPYRALLDKGDRRPVLRAATVLSLADELNRRIPPDGRAEVACGWGKRGFGVAAAVPPTWRPRAVAERFQRVFGRPLLVEAR